jgi:hypothetical protein
MIYFPIEYATIMIWIVLLDGVLFLGRKTVEINDYLFVFIFYSIVVMLITIVAIHNTIVDVSALLSIVYDIVLFWWWLE